MPTIFGDDPPAAVHERRSCFDRKAFWVHSRSSRSGRWVNSPQCTVNAVARNRNAWSLRERADKIQIFWLLSLSLLSMLKRVNIARCYSQYGCSVWSDEWLSHGMFQRLICEFYQWLANRGFIDGVWAWVSKCSKIGTMQSTAKWGFQRIVIWCLERPPITTLAQKSRFGP